MASDDGEVQKRKRDSPTPTEDKPNVESEIQKQPDETSPPPKRQKSDASDSSDSDCISQEDLLAQLGLNSVKKLKTDESVEKKVVHPEPPKQSILEFLTCPVISRKVEASAHPPKERLLTNGYLDGVDEYDEDEENDDNALDRKEKSIARLQNNLRNEEAKLLLLRKLYACQNDKTADAKAAPARAPVTTATTTHAAQPSAAAQRKPAQVAVTQKQVLQSNKVQQSANVQPRVVFLTQPPRGGQPVIIAPKLVPVSAGKALQEAVGSRSNVRPLSVSVTQNSKSGAVGTKVVQRGQTVHPTAVYATHSGSSANTGPTAAKKLVRAASGGDKLPSSMSENGVVKTTVVHSPAVVPQPPQQTLSEAKITLRKQLERTLLQIPLPKAPVQDWDFVPSVNTQDFTILIGLEGVVNHIMESKEETSSKAEPKITPPKFCSQCDTDFTSAWRKKLLEGDESKKIITTLCEICCTQKIKKTLKTDHTNRLKAAFVKAVKQEQEVEQKFHAAGKGTADGGKSGARQSTSHHVVPSLQTTRVVYHPSVHHSVQPQVFQPHPSIVHQLQQQQLQQQQHQDVDSSGRPQQETTRYFTYVGQHNFQSQHNKQRHNYAGDSDRQREYLLDMIPSGHGSRGYRI